MLSRFWIVGVGCVCALAACGDNKAPVFDPLEDQTAVVGVEFALELRASDADGDKLRFSVSAPAIPDLESRESPATIQSFADGVAIFRWVPTAADRSETPYAFDFKVNDGKATTTETINITVKDSVGSAPIFRQPLGSGRPLDLDQTDQIEVQILVEDTDSTSVTITEGTPKIEGGMLDQTGPFEATWTWKPSADQISARSIYTLTLNAEDEEGNKAVPKTYMIVLRKKADESCPGTPPTITHLPPSGTQTTINDIKITAEVMDDVGLKSPPLFYYSTPDVTSTPVQLSMTAVAGSDTQYEGFIPNPVASAAAGTKQTVYYTIVATDNDDAAGTACDKTTQAPTTGTFMVEVEKPTMTMPGKGVCEGPCTSDAQCGGDSDHCIQIGSSGKFFCSRICGGSNPACPDGYNCSASNVSSIDGKSARQCLPKTGTCGSAATCDDDNLEQNDALDAVMNTTSLNITKATDTAKTNTQTYSTLAICPNGAVFDEDWYAFKLSTTTNTMLYVKATVSVGTDLADVDFETFLQDGYFLPDGKDSSYSSGADEEISACFRYYASAPDTLGYLHVLSVDDPKPGYYNMTITTTPDDSNEPNDSDAMTTEITLPYQRTGLVLCPHDEDWYETPVGGLFAEKFVIDLKFAQTRATQDLDVYFYRNATGDMGTGLIELGKAIGTVANEHLEVVVPAGPIGSGYIRVVGKDDRVGNTYELQVSATTP